MCFHLLIQLGDGHSVDQLAQVFIVIISVIVIHLSPRLDIFIIALEFSVISFLQRLAALTPGFAGADIANICNEVKILINTFRFIFVYSY